MVAAGLVFVTGYYSSGGQLGEIEASAENGRPSGATARVTSLPTLPVPSWVSVGLSPVPAAL